MKVSIESITYTDELERAVFRATDPNGAAARYVSHKAIPRCPVEGECWDLEYVEEVHPNHGPQRRVVKGALVRPTGTYLINVLSRHPALRGLGIGPVTALKIYEAHGPSLVDILDKGDSSAIYGLADDAAWELCQRWQTLALEPGVVRWLEEKGIEARLASRLLALYGGQSIAAMEANPYCLLPFVSFEKIDAMARARLGIAVNDPRRLVAAVEAALYTDMDDGHTATKRSSLTRSLRATVGNNAEQAIDLTLSQKVAFASGVFIQAYAVCYMERDIESWLADIHAPGAEQSEMEIVKGDDHVESLIDQQATRDGLGLTDEQRAAVLGGLRNRLHCICGGAGVGKTTVLKMLASLICAIHGNACFMAISGRAARRIADALGPNLASRCTIKTVAGYLKSTAPALDPDSAPWLIVDEASMLDLQNAHRIIRRSPVRSRLVLVGDPNQLPPVGAGLVFHRLVESPKVSRTVLTKVWRQAAATGIPAAAEDIRDGRVPDWSSFDGAGHGVQFVPADKGSVIAEATRIREALASAGEVQVLTLFRDALGARAINEAMHAKVPPATPKLHYPMEVAVGEPVIYTKNDPKIELTNGSVGYVTRINQENSITVLWDDGHEREMKGQHLWYCELAHGITTHKAQGSQYERVVIVVPRRSPILDRTLIYTAVTRAKRQAVLVGDEDAIRDAIISESNASRRSVLFLTNSSYL